MFRSLFSALLLIVLSPAAHAATLNVTAFGAQCNGIADDTAAIQAAFNAASSGDVVQLPAGTCLYSNTLTLNGKVNVHVFGAGMDTSKLEGTNPSKSAVRVINGTTMGFRDFQITVPTASVRSGHPDTTGFFIDGGSGINFQRVKVDRVASAGILAFGVMYIGVYDSDVRNTLADGIHVTGGSYSATIARNWTVNTGDDSYACVGYGTAINHYVGFYDNTTTNSQASGVTVEGCEFVEVHRNTVRRSRVSGIRVASSDFWSTGRINEVDVRWNTIDTCPLGDKVNHSSVLIATDNQVVEHVHVRDNVILAPQAWSVLRLYGINGGTVRNSEIERNTATGGSGITDCIAVQPSHSNITVFGNTRNGSPCT